MTGTVATVEASGECRPLGLDRAALLELRASNFEIEAPDGRARLAMDLIGCLGDPDPVLRDQIAYEGYVALLRGKQLDESALHELRNALLSQLLSTEPDPMGFQRPFVALVLSEVARTDRIDPYLSDSDRSGLLDAATQYIRSIRDYRGFSEQQGWRHGVAHASDFLLQLALNPALTSDQLTDILGAVASQVSPPETHFYVYGEPGRLARPVFAIAQRGLVADEEWASWFNALKESGTEGMDTMFSSQAGLAQLHNYRAFAETLYVSATASGSDALEPIRVGALEVLRALP